MRKTVSLQKLSGTEIYYGTDYFSDKPICFDRRNIIHPNGMVFGQAGYGKTFIVKQEICQVISKTADQIIIIDAGGEYSGLATDINPFDEQSQYHINPLDVYISSDTCEDNIPYDVAFAIFAEMLGRPLTPYEYAVVERACNTVFKPFIKRLKAEGKHYDYVSNPTLKDVADVLIALPKSSELQLIDAVRKTIQKETDNENKDFSSRIMYCIEKTFCHRAVGGLTEEIQKMYLYIDRFFSCKTNMPDDRVIQLSWRYMPNKISKAAYINCLHYAWNRLVQHSDNMRNAKECNHLWIYLENSDAAFHSVTEGLARSIMNLYRGSRPYGGIVTLIAQDYTDILNNDESQSCICNAEFLIFLNMSLTDRENIRKMYDLSDDMINHICDVSCGHGLLAINSDWIPFELRDVQERIESGKAIDMLNEMKINTYISPQPNLFIETERKPRKNSFIFGTSGSGKAMHPWDNLKRCPKCGCYPWIVGKDMKNYESGSPYMIICMNKAKCDCRSLQSYNVELCIEDWNQKT